MTDFQGKGGTVNAKAVIFLAKKIGQIFFKQPKRTKSRSVYPASFADPVFCSKYDYLVFHSCHFKIRQSRSRNTGSTFGNTGESLQGMGQ